MSLLDFLLNLAGLLLWLQWRAAPMTIFSPVPGKATILPQRVAPPRARWIYLLGLLALLFVRAVFYREAGPPLDWRPVIALGPVRLFFRCEFFARMLLYSALSFGATLWVFFLCLLVFSSLDSSSAAENGPTGQWLRRNLGPVNHWPAAVKLLLPLAFVIAVWCACSPLLQRLGIVPEAKPWQILAQGAVIGLAACLVLKFFVLGLLLLHLINSYVYLGDLPLWNFVGATARRLLIPLRWLPLRLGRIDFSPVVGIALVVLLASLAASGLARIYH